MEKYKTKNNIVTAIEYYDLPKVHDELHDEGIVVINNDNCSILSTPNGTLEIRNGDFFIKGINGNYFVMEREKFLSSHEIYNEEDNSICEVPKKNAAKQNDDEIYVDKKQIKKYQIISYISLAIETVIIICPTLIYSNYFHKNIESFISIAYQEKVEQESKELLAKTKIEAQLIIEEAKINAEKEADESFRKEIERLTQDKLRKSK